jgi:hypothetical protein
MTLIQLRDTDEWTLSALEHEPQMEVGMKFERRGCYELLRFVDERSTGLAAPCAKCLRFVRVGYRPSNR